MTATAEPDTTVVAEPARAAAPEPEAEAKPRDILIICYSGELEKTWATMILATTGAAMGAKVRVFLTFWGLQTFVKDEKRITGDNVMQKMMSFMQRPGISHRKLSKMNFLGMGPWMMRKLAKQYNVGEPQGAPRGRPGDGRRVHALPDDDGHVRPQAGGHDRRPRRAGRRRHGHRRCMQGGDAPLFI